jgi:hypothetical protein
MITKILVRALLIEALLFMLSIGIGLIVPDTYEARSVFYQLIIDGYLSLIIFIIILINLVILGIALLLKKEWIAGIVWTLFPSLIIFFGSFLFALFLRDLGLYNEDSIIYRNKKDKIIIQYYETGVTGNPKARVIRTFDDIDASFREIEEITLTGYEISDFMDFVRLSAACSTAPQSIEFKGVTYDLVDCKK